MHHRLWLSRSIWVAALVGLVTTLAGLPALAALAAETPPPTTPPPVFASPWAPAFDSAPGPSATWYTGGLTDSGQSRWNNFYGQTPAPPPPPSQPAPPAPPPATPPAPGPVPPSPGPGGLSGAEQELVRLINAERVQAGLMPLAVDARLVALAHRKAQDMVQNGYFGHVSPTLGSPYTMLQAAGVAYRWAGENIARIRGGPAEVHRAFMASPGHRANVLSRAYTHVGVALTTDRLGKTIAAEWFIQPR